VAVDKLTDRDSAAAPGAGSDKQKIVLATGNKGKLREIQSLLGEAWQLIPQSEFGIEPAEETGATFVENALIKARHAAGIAKLPAIADDSGLEVDALGGAPGIRSARYAGTDGDDEANNRKLLAELGDIAPVDRSARFRCVVVYVRGPDDPDPLMVEGAWEGHIADAPAGLNGFGYDPLFVDAGSGQTGGQLGADRKNRLSHRGLAVRQLRSALEALNRTSSVDVMHNPS
jgi:XTP/dITP diphosphohydrolase